VSDNQYNLPLPSMQGLTKQFYDFCKQHELRFQRCKPCGAWRHVPREMCPECGSMEWEWAKSSGKGTVYTWTVAVRAMHPAFMTEVPYAPVVIEMDEGVRLLSTVLDCGPEELEVGMPVEVVYQDVTNEVSLAKFRRRR
jgi:uncharacterized OB-fold protein